MQHLVGTLLLFPVWLVDYFVRTGFPRHQRGEVQLGVRDFRKLPPAKSLKESRAMFIPPFGSEWVKGILKSAFVKPVPIPGYIYGAGKKDVGGMKVGKGDSVLLFFHGGGLIIGSAYESDITGTSGIPKAIIKHGKIKHCLAVTYRKVGQEQYPAQILDCLCGYAYLVSKVGVSPKNILLAGDSAGGHLTFAVTRYLRDEGFELPGAILAFSPWVDMTRDVEPKLSLLQTPTNNDIDYLNTYALQPYTMNKLVGLNPVSIIDSPYLSPAGGTVPATPALFRDFPPCFVTAGGKECLLDPIEELIKRLKLSGVEFVYDVEENAVHDYQIAPWFQPAMARRIFKKVGNWIDDKF